MPELTPQSTPSPVPPVTPQEAEARRILKRVLELVSLLRWFLEEVHFRLPDPPDAEAMGTGAIPESLTFALRGAIECSLMDHVAPLEKVLQEAVTETPVTLFLDWQKRQKGK